LNIIQALRDDRIFRRQFKDVSTWRAWEVYLRGLFGLPIDGAKDRALFRECTGLKTTPKDRARESFVICGRRSGKSFISAIIAVFLAVFKDWRPYLSPGEKGWIFIFAVDKAQASIVKNYVSGIITGNRSLAAMVKQETKEAIELKNNVNISVKTSNFRTVRGFTIVCAIMEEIAFWRSEESANPDREILAAIRPALATVPESLLIGISTPYARAGVLWEQFKSNWGKTGGPFIWRAKTEIMNCTIDRKIIAAQLKEDPAMAKAEWQVEWREDVQAFLAVEMIEAAVVPGRFELPKIADASYSAFCDPSGGRQDSMTLAITHKEKASGRVVLDVLRERRPPFTPQAVVSEFADVMKSFGIHAVSADRYAGEWVSAAFSSCGIQVRNSELSASESYLNFLPMVSNGTVELLDNKRLVAQLAGLERKTRSGGKDSIDHFPGSHDDVAVAAAGACVKAQKPPTGFHVWSLGAVDREATPTETAEERANREKAAAEAKPVKVRVLKSMKGSPDGIHVEFYKEGTVYEIPISLARIFVGEGWAIYLEGGNDGKNES